MPFVHLRTHTEYSVVDGTLRIADAVAAAAADHQGALAITDLCNLFGAIKFYKACRGAGIKPIIGADLWLEPEAGDKAPSRMLVLVQNRQGYLNLCELLSRAWTTNAQRTQAWVKWDWFDGLADGLIALSGADQGCVGVALLAGDMARAQTLALRAAQRFPGRFYLEVQRGCGPTNEAHVRAAVPLAAQTGLPVVATHGVQFLTGDDYEAHEARVCIAEGETLANPRRVKRFTREQSFKSQAQMQAAFADLPSALANAIAIAERCSLSLSLGKPRLPDFPTPGGLPIDAFFRQQSLDGLDDRLGRLFPDPAERALQAPRYRERLEFEIKTIVAMGFPGYFLIVSDFITWAKQNGCPVGPGRGSGAGSLVAYALKITDLDPIAYGLLFERFLNPERVSMPDFDIDFCQANRDRVIDYVKDRYGRDAVSQITTFGTMAAKAALRDVGRVLGMGYGHVDSIAKLIPAPPGKVVTLAQIPESPDPGLVYARKEAPELGQREAAEEEVAELLALATRVEGIVRNIGMHAGGVLIAPGRITDFCPLYQQPGSTSAVSQFDKDDVEAIGLVKFDFLGLATLTILELARGFIIAADPQHRDFAFDQVPLDDAAVYRLFADGHTEAVFQFESRGMQAMLKEARPTRLEDLIAMNAMFRPGPMDNIPSFCKRKHGEEPVTYPHPLAETVLAETYGIMVYQEQVMQVAQVMGGYSLGGADLLRRAMGKKKPEEMAQQRAIFRDGAAVKGIAAATADETFDLMEKFAGYGFNKSHAAAYALLAYHTAWLKVRHPAAFYAANMTVEMDDTDKLAVLLADARRFGIEFDPPDVNRSVHRFEPITGAGGKAGVRYGLGAIKGTGAGAIEAIVAARDLEGPFRGLFDFCARIDRGRVNKRVVEALVKAGAFDRLQPDRASLLASIPLAFDWADSQLVNENQAGLFDFGDGDGTIHGSSTQEPALIAAEAWSVRQRLMLEKTAIGFYLSGHLFDHSQAEVRRIARKPVADLSESREPQLVAGIVAELRIVNGQRGRVAIFKLDDKTAAIEAVVADELIEAHRDRLKDDELLIVQGRVQPDRFSGGQRLNVTQIWDMAAARAQFGRHLGVTVSGVLPDIGAIVARFPPRSDDTAEVPIRRGLAVRVMLRRERYSAEIELGEAGWFWPSDDALDAWKAVVASDAAPPVVAYDG